MPKKAKSPVDTSQKLPRRFSKGRVIFLSIVGVVLVSVAALVSYSFAYAQKIAPNVTVDGIQVGGLSRSAAEQKLTESEQRYLDQKITLQYSGKSWDVYPKDLGLTFSHADALDQAYQYAKTGSIFDQIEALVVAPLRAHAYTSDLYPIGETGKNYMQQQVLKSIEQPPAETSLSFTPGKVAVVPGQAGKLLDYSRFNQGLYETYVRQATSLSLTLKEFQPELTVDQAETARSQAQYVLGGAWKVIGATTTVDVDPRDIAAVLDTTVQRDASGKALALQLKVKEDELKKVITGWATKINKPSTNATVKWENNQLSIVSAGQNGIAVDEAASLLAVKPSLTQPVMGAARQLTLVVAASQPAVRAETLASLGIKELIGSATTDFSGSPTNRAANIGVGQRSLNQQIVADGETFSTITALGPIDQDHGYLPELVILNNRTVPQAGGGLCQVSTTLFRAVLNAGLLVTERTNHAYRVGYYERGVGPGLDATIYDPSPDFKWKNDTGHAVLVQSHIEGTKITFDLYGTKDGRTSTISAPQIISETPPGDPIYSQTDTLYKGEQKQIETAHAGAVTSVVYTVTRDGAVINRQTFRSTYKPWPAQYLVGTKDRPS